MIWVRSSAGRTRKAQSNPGETSKKFRKCAESSKSHNKIPGFVAQLGEQARLKAIPAKRAKSSENAQNQANFITKYLGS